MPSFFPHSLNKSLLKLFVNLMSGTAMMGDGLLAESSTGGNTTVEIIEYVRGETGFCFKQSKCKTLKPFDDDLFMISDSIMHLRKLNFTCSIAYSAQFEQWPM